MIDNINKVRRRFIINLSSLPILSLSSFAWSKPTQDIVFTKALTDVFSQRDSAKLIGKTYLETSIEQVSFTQLLNNIRLEHPALENTAANNKAELNKLIKSIHQDDFKHERTIHVDGWIMSRIETQICALMNFV